ncbi:MAG: hypothetical protein AAB306_00215 [Pseudomonadota bacterium]
MKENRVKTISLLFLMVSGLILGASVVEAGGDHHHGHHHHEHHPHGGYAVTYGQPYYEQPGYGYNYYPAPLPVPVPAPVYAPAPIYAYPPNVVLDIDAGDAHFMLSY